MGAQEIHPQNAKFHPVVGESTHPRAKPTPPASQSLEIPEIHPGNGKNHERQLKSASVVGKKLTLLANPHAHGHTVHVMFQNACTFLIITNMNCLFIGCLKCCNYK